MKKSHVSTFDHKKFQESILSWYDENRRILPWRASPTKIPDPYHVWLSEIMLQQTTVRAVHAYFERFLALWPTIHDLAAADSNIVMKEWAGLGYYARARNLLKCATIIANQYKGVFPSKESDLIKLPGIGSYTAAAISAIAFNQQSVVIDGNIDRIIARLFKIETAFPKGKKDVKEFAPILYHDIKSRAADFPQALMDIGAIICTPTTPQCEKCPVISFCQSYKNGNPSSYPKRLKKEKKPERFGCVYWVETKEKKVIVEKRKETRMLGGMMGLPTTDWDNKSGTENIPSNLKALPFYKKGEIQHVFTHFSLKLDVLIINPHHEICTDDIVLKENQFLIPIKGIEEEGFPSVFQKVISLVRT